MRVDLDGVVLVVRRLDIVELLLVIRKLANHLLQAATALAYAAQTGKGAGRKMPSMLLGRSCGMGRRS